MERSKGIEEGCESQGFAGEDTKGNTVRHTGYRCGCCDSGGEKGCSLWLGFGVGEVEVDCERYVDTELV